MKRKKNTTLDGVLDEYDGSIGTFAYVLTALAVTIGIIKHLERVAYEKKNIQ